MSSLTPFKKNLIVFALVGLTVGGGIAQSGPQKKSTRHVFVRGGKKVYTLLPVTRRRMKSLEQMKLEATKARTRFHSVLDNPQKPIPQSKDMLEYITPVKDQAHRGACVAFASVALVETLIRMTRGQVADLSEQYIYWASKKLDGVIPNSDGSFPLDMLNALNKHGVPLEKAWPYEPNPWFADEKGHKNCFDAYKANPENVPTECVTNGDPSQQAGAAPKVRVAKQQNIETSPEAIIAFLNLGVPVEIGVDVYQGAWGFDNPDSADFKAGRVKMPAQGDQVIGGHAILIVGYDMASKTYLIKNSWGFDDWGSQATWTRSQPSQRIRAVNGVVRTPGLGTIPMDYVRQFGEASVAKVML